MEKIEFMIIAGFQEENETQKHRQGHHISVGSYFFKKPCPSISVLYQEQLYFQSPRNQQVRKTTYPEHLLIL
jgi:hypothetical protein